jgi:hygromycin-B 7''-O-kinase
MKLPSPSLLTPLYDLDGYRRYFTDASFWAPFISAVFSRHDLPIIGTPRCGVPGSYPTFIVSDRWVIKFFGPLFDGLACYQVEHAASQLLHPPDFPVPALVSTGHLFPSATTEFSWPYLISEYIPALSIGEVYDQVCSASMLSLARLLGGLLKRIHLLPLPPDSPLPSNWSSYTKLLNNLASDCPARQAAWGSLPSHLLSEIPAYLLPATKLLPAAPSPALIHADLTRDHLLGELHNGDWRLRAIIDFGDAISGDLFYELVVIHLELFNADLNLLREFLTAYQPSPFHQQDFVRKAMTLTLLFPYNLFECIFPRRPELYQSSSLSELADRLWKVT